MANAKIILGTQFGDEGKGLVTDYLTGYGNIPAVVRFSGGQQAGHTVIFKGKKFVFSSYCSGTLRGYPSYISEYCTIFLNTMDEEYRLLRSMGIYPELTVHPLAMVTTPYDVAYNRVTEALFNKHGSVGLGVGATMKRNYETPYKLYAVDLLNLGLFTAKMGKIKQYYEDKFTDPAIKRAFTIETREFLLPFMDLAGRINFEIAGYPKINKYETVLFEGSQGILLDMDHGVFPNVTYGHTTSRNALKICKKMGLKRIDVCYVARCYQTRHGTGWMSNNRPVDLVNNQGEINVSHTWQGDFRTAELDYELINHAMRIDDIYSRDVDAKMLYITCLDQRPGFKLETSKLDLNKINMLYGSYGPTADDITIYKPRQSHEEKLSDPVQVHKQEANSAVADICGG